jgi:hypothetical protein
MRGGVCGVSVWAHGDERPWAHGSLACDEEGASSERVERCTPGVPWRAACVLVCGVRREFQPVRKTRVAGDGGRRVCVKPARARCGTASPQGVPGWRERVTTLCTRCARGCKGQHHQVLRGAMVRMGSAAAAAWMRELSLAFGRDSVSRNRGAASPSTHLSGVDSLLQHNAPPIPAPMHGSVSFHRRNQQLCC